MLRCVALTNPIVVFAVLVLNDNLWQWLVQIFVGQLPFLLLNQQC